MRCRTALVVRRPVEEAAMEELAYNTFEAAMFFEVGLANAKLILSFIKIKLGFKAG